ncbi:hypothetical protein G6F38_012370 [Rhizopus arrhizus]|nr:hypothetical protein G6F38_012370 [Rhizopus arrhizus]
MILVNSLVGLFFGNRVRVNINGHFTDEVTQSRGLREGDPLSPLLFNLALEPFLRHVLQHTSLIGFSFLPLPADPNPPPAVKVLAYADDVCVFLSSPTDFLRLQHHLQTYGQVSNAKVNLSKTEAIFLNGKSSNQWQQLLTQHQILKWHDHTKTQPLRYLGFPVIQSTAQRRYVEDHLLQNIKTQCSIYSQRNLSLRGRVTVTNTLLLSKLWYSLRVISLPKSFFRQIRSAIYQFISKGIKPGFRYALFCQPLSQGGLVSQDTVVQAISLLQQGKSVREVERITGLSKSAVGRLQKSHCFGLGKPKGGRPKLLSAADERYCVRQVTKNRISSATKVAKELEKDTERKVSVDTVCRALRKAGLGAIRKPKKPLLSAKNIRKRLSWDMAHKDWTVDDWKCVV